MKYYIPCFLVIFLFTGCKEKEVQMQGVREINLQNVCENKTNLKLSQVAKSIEYVRLETGNQCMLGEFPRIYINTEYIIAISFRKMYLFDRLSGKFIREIGRYDKGPEGYAATEFTMPFDVETNKIQANGWEPGVSYEYSISGKLEEKIKTPQNSSSLCQLNDSIYIAYIKNYAGDENKKLITFSKSNFCIHVFPNHLSFKPTTTDVVAWGTQGWFYKYKGQPSFFELFTDTIYRVSPDCLAPCYVFNMGKFKPPYDKQMVADFMIHKAKDYYFLRTIFESENYLFFFIEYNNKSHLGFFDKTTNTTMVNNPKDKEPDLYENDLDHFLPLKFSSISKNDELIGFLDAYKAVQWFNANPDKASRLPEQLRTYKNIKETDNPVVMIVKLK